MCQTRRQNLRSQDKTRSSQRYRERNVEMTQRTIDEIERNVIFYLLSELKSLIVFRKSRSVVQNGDVLV